MTSHTFDKKQLTKDTLSAISQFSAGGELVGHDGRDYAIVSHADAAVSMSKTLMTLQEIADYLRVTRSTIHRLLKNNQIPAFRIGRHWRFNLEEIENWCCSRRSSEELRQDPATDD